MGFNVKARVDGIADLMAQLDGLKKSVRNKILRKAVSNAGKTLLWAARARVAGFKRTGLLYKSLGRKVKVYPSGAVVAIVGARKGFKQIIGVRKRDSRPGTKYPKAAGDPIYADPTKYLHLVELGTKRSRAYEPLKQALETNKVAIAAQMRKDIQDGLKGALGK